MKMPDFKIGFTKKMTKLCIQVSKYKKKEDREHSFADKK